MAWKGPNTGRPPTLWRYFRVPTTGVAGRSAAEHSENVGPREKPTKRQARRPAGTWMGGSVLLKKGCSEQKCSGNAEGVKSCLSCLSRVLSWRGAQGSVNQNRSCCVAAFNLLLTRRIAMIGYKANAEETVRRPWLDLRRAVSAGTAYVLRASQDRQQAYRGSESGASRGPRARRAQSRRRRC